MTTIPYLKQYDNPITDYIKQYNKLLKQANPNVNELKNLLETFAVHEILIDKHDVTEDELLTHIYILNNQLGNDPQDYGGFSEIDLRAEMRIKIAAEKATLNNFEKTMSPYQLYASGSPLWTSELTAEEADAVLKHTVGTCTLTEDEFNDRYQKALNGELTKKPFVLNFWQ